MTHPVGPKVRRLIDDRRRREARRVGAVGLISRMREGLIFGPEELADRLLFLRGDADLSALAQLAPEELSQVRERLKAWSVTEGWINLGQDRRPCRGGQVVARRAHARGLLAVLPLVVLVHQGGT